MSAFAPRTTTFIGRETDLEEVVALLHSRRLVTLVGPGGCGKTSLAVATGTAIEHTFTDGATFVDLAPVLSGDLVPNAFAAAADVPEQGAAGLVAVIITALASRHELVVVDNCEGVLDACAPLVDAIVRRCPDVIVLATSREPLGVDGETTWRVPSLTLPTADATDPLAALRESGAGALLLDRAQLARPDLEWSTDDVEAAARICRRLDGIPLALELAASRLRAYSPVELVHGLDDRFALLTVGPRTAPPRQRTLEASISWSYDLLDEPAARLLRRLSVFTGTFVLDDARAVCRGDGIEDSAIWALLADLVDRSLVQSEPDGYRLLESVAQYAAKRLVEGGEDEAVHLAHLTHFADVAHQFDLQAGVAEHLGLTARIGFRLGDMRKAMDWALGADRATEAMQLAADLRLFWLVEAKAKEGRMWLEAGLAADPRTDARARAHALLAAAHLALLTYDPQRQAELSGEALQLSRDVGDPSLEGRAIVLDGYSKLFVDPAAARHRLEEGRRLAEELDETVRVEFASFGCGAAALLTGDLVGAVTELTRGIELAEKRETFGVAFGRGSLGYAHMLMGDIGRAVTLTGEAFGAGGRDARTLEGQWHALALAHGGRLDEAHGWIDKVTTEANALGNPTFLLAVDAAWLDVASGRNASATTLLTAAVSQLELIGAAWYEVQARRLLGDAAAGGGGGDHGAARDHRTRAMEVAERSGNPLARTLALIGLARSCDDDAARVRTLLRDAIRAATGARYAIGMIDAAEALAAHSVSDEILELPARARLLDAIDAERVRTGYVRFPCDVAAYRRARESTADAAAGGSAEADAATLHDALAAAFRGDRRPPRPIDGWQSLTPAEVRIARLVAEGLTNPEIGARLFLSRRTVQSHLSHVFAKLGVTGRAELAAQVARGPGEGA